MRPKCRVLNTQHSLRFLELKMSYQFELGLAEFELTKPGSLLEHRNAVELRQFINPNRLSEFCHDFRSVAVKF